MLMTREALTLFLCHLILNIVNADDGHAIVDKGNEGQICGTTNATSTRNPSNIRMIKAQEAEKGAWPWMAEVYRTGRNKKNPTCGGVLISHSYVVTAGNCLLDRGVVLSPKNVSVRLGDHDLESEKDGMKPVDFNVTSISVHEEFDPVTFWNDIALLHLQRPANFSKFIQPICLPDESLSDEDLASMTGYVAGWGASTFGGPTSHVLTEMSAVVTNDDVCRDSYEGKATITNENICTVGINGSSPCQGFGGAPLMLPGKDNRYYFGGIVSYGIGCGNPNYPDVYTRVTAFLDWIQEHMI